MQKYEFTNNKKMVTDCDGVERELTQIVSTKSFQNVHGDFVPSGTLGGWIERESNLSQDGNSWLNEKSYAFHDSMIAGNAYVENSFLYHESGVEDDAYIYESKLHNEALVCGVTEVHYSLLYKNTTLGGICYVENSNLTNVRLLVGSKDRAKWKSCHFENVRLKSDTYLVECESDVFMKDVHLTGRKIKVEHPISLERVHGESIERFLVKQELEMSDVFMKEGVNFLVKGNKKTGLIGKLGDEQGRAIVIHSDCILKNSWIHDQVQIHGNWIINSSQLSGDSMLKNDSDKTHILERTRMSELARITATGSFDNAKTVTVELEMDNEYQIK